MRANGSDHSKPGSYCPTGNGCALTPPRTVSAVESIPSQRCVYWSMGACHGQAQLSVFLLPASDRVKVQSTTGTTYVYQSDSWMHIRNNHQSKNPTSESIWFRSVNAEHYRLALINQRTASVLCHLRANAGQTFRKLTIITFLSRIICSNAVKVQINLVRLILVQKISAQVTYW